MTQIEEDYKIIRLINTCRYLARNNSRLPFGPFDNILEKPDNERAIMLENVATMLEEGLTVVDKNEDAETNLKELQNLFAEVSGMLLKLHDALTEGDEDGTPCDWITELVRECSSKKIDAEEDDVFESVDKIRGAMESVRNVIAEIESSPLLSLIRATQPDTLPRIMQIDTDIRVS